MEKPMWSSLNSAKADALPKQSTRLSRRRAMTARRPVKIPAGSWPLEMRAETAAAYCDEPSVEAFLAKVRQRIYSAPTRAKGCLPKWHRWNLDRDIARRHGLQFNISDIAEDVMELI
jgi:hypothetical protein